MNELKAMTPGELWALFPIILKEHNSAYAAWYQEEANRLYALFGSDAVFRISHIGSTAVPGLLAKPTIDILLELYACNPAVTALLETRGWLLMAKGSPVKSALDLNKGYTPSGFAERVFHLHIRPSGDWDELYFRDYLLAHAEAAKEYASLKRSLLEKFEHDRDGYTAAKSRFIRQYSVLAKKEYAGRYTPQRGVAADGIVVLESFDSD